MRAFSGEQYSEKMFFSIIIAKEIVLSAKKIFYATSRLVSGRHKAPSVEDRPDAILGRVLLREINGDGEAAPSIEDRPEDILGRVLLREINGDGEAAPSVADRPYLC